MREDPRVFKPVKATFYISVALQRLCFSLLSKFYVYSLLPAPLDPRFLVHHIRHLRGIPPVISFQHINDCLDRAPSHPFFGINREPRDLRPTGEMME